MKLFTGRPLCFGCVGAAAAAFFCAYSGYAAAFVLAAAAFVLAVLSFLFVKPRGGVDRRLYFVLLFSLVCAVSLSGALYHYSVSGYETEDTVFVTGYVDPSLRSGDSYKITVTNLDGRPCSVDMYADFGHYAPYDFAKFSAYAKVSRADGEDSFYLNGHGVFYQAELSRVSFNGTQKGFLYRVNNIRKYISSRFYAVSGRGDLYSCLFLGRRDLSPYSLSRDFKSLGITHLLAVSGLHVAALLAGAEFLLYKIFGKRKFVFVILAAAALFYAALAGFSGSVVRASVMYFIMSAGKMFGMKSDGMTGLSLSAASIFFVCPYAVYDLGLILLSAASGIILIGVPLALYLHEKTSGKGAGVRLLSYTGESFAVTLSALVFTLPAAAFGYGEVVFISLLANLIVAPFIMILLYACPYLILLSFIPFAGQAAGAFCDGIAEIAARGAHALTSLPPLSLSVKYAFVPYMLLFFAAALIIMIFTGVRSRVFYGVFCSAFILSFIGGALIFNATFAQKDVMIMQSSARGELIAVCSDGKCTVFDLSSGASAYDLKTELLKYGVTSVDYVCAPEFTSYHVQSVSSNCRTFRVGTLYLPDSVGADLTERICGKETEPVGAAFAVGRINVLPEAVEAGEKRYKKLDLGVIVYTDAPFLSDGRTVIYGKNSADAAYAASAGSNVYLHEKYKDMIKPNNNTEFYGDIAVIELK